MLGKKLNFVDKTYFKQESYKKLTIFLLAFYNKSKVSKISVGYRIPIVDIKKN